MLHTPLSNGSLSLMVSKGRASNMRSTPRVERAVCPAPDTLHRDRLVGRRINFLWGMTIFEFAGWHHLLVFAIPTHHLA